MRSWKKIFPLGLLLALANCQTYSSHGYTLMMETWQGKDTRDLVNAWGYPNKKHMSPEGNEVFEYEEVKFRSNSFTSLYNVYKGINISNSSSTTEQSSCKSWFEIKENKIVKAHAKGKDCVLPGVIILGALAQQLEDKKVFAIVPDTSLAHKKGIRPGDSCSGYTEKHSDFYKRKTKSVTSLFCHLETISKLEKSGKLLELVVKRGDKVINVSLDK